MSIYKPARDFSFYKEMGVSLEKLGCVTLNTEFPLFEDYPGMVSDPHVTLRYGFLVPPVTKEHIEQVLSDWKLPDQIRIIGLDAFLMGNGTEAIVALVENLQLGFINKALGVLPNVVTFVDYKPHITIGYYPDGFFEKNKDKFLDNLRLVVETGGISFNKVLG